MTDVFYPAEFSSARIAKQCSEIFWPEWSSSVVFENKGVDVEITARVGLGRPAGIADRDLPPALRRLAEKDRFTIEIKPTVGDDYPTVLRQMHAGKVEYLFLEEYTGKGATLEQFLGIFAASGRTVIFKDRVDEEFQRLLRPYEPEFDWDADPVPLHFDEFDPDID
jgi:hypothetical protein